MSLVIKLTWIYQNHIWFFQTIVQSTSYTAFLEHSIPRFVQYLREGKILFYSVHISLHRKLYSASSATSTCIFFVFTGEPHFVTEVPTQVHWHVNLQCPNVRMFSVDTILHTFPIVLTRRIVLINKSFFTQSVHDWPVRSSQTFNSFLSFAVSVTMFVTKWLNRVSQCPYTFLTPSFLATEKTFTWDSASYTYQWTS